MIVLVLWIFAQAVVSAFAILFTLALAINCFENTKRK